MDLLKPVELRCCEQLYGVLLLKAFIDARSSRCLAWKRWLSTPFDVGMVAHGSRQLPRFMSSLVLNSKLHWSPLGPLPLFCWLVILGEHCWDVMFDWGHVWRWKRSLREVPPVAFRTGIELWEWSSSQCLIAPCQNWCHISATMAKVEPQFGKHEARCWLVDTFWNIKPLGFLSSCCDCDDRNSLQFIGFFGQRSTHSTVIRLDQARCSDGTQHLSARPWSLGGALVGRRCYNRSILWKSEKSDPALKVDESDLLFDIFWHINESNSGRDCDKRTWS